MEPEVQTTPARSRNSLAIPVAIIIGFALIAVAIYLTGNRGAENAFEDNRGTNTEEETGDPSSINPVTEDDHVRGNPNAPVVLVEYSDYDCPYCKNFHETMQQIMDEYGTDGKVAWVYRHFPLQQLHPNAATIALASECVAAETGNTGFWEFSDLVFAERGTNEPTNITRLEEFATTAGADATTFNACLEAGTYQDDVEEDYSNAIAIGGRGTPHTIILVGDQQGVINGAQSYNTVKQIIDELLTQIEGGV